MQHGISNCLFNDTGNPNRPEIVSLAKTIEDLIKVKTCSGMMGGSEDDDDDEQDGQGEEPPTVTELAEEAAQEADQAAPSSRAVSRTTPLPRKTKGAQQHIQDFTEKFGKLADVITSSIQARNNAASIASADNHSNNDGRLKKLEDEVSCISSQVQGMARHMEDMKNILQILMARVSH